VGGEGGGLGIQSTAFGKFITSIDDMAVYALMMYEVMCTIYLINLFLLSLCFCTIKGSL